jgi:hypothetical protein
MQIAVFGSWHDSHVKEWGLVDRPAFINAAASIGSAIVRNGHTLLVGGDSENTADFHAATAVVATLGASYPKPRIRIIGARDRGPAFQELRRNAPSLFTEQFVPADNWASVKVFQAKEADGLVILAGANGSLQAGLTAGALGKRLVCVGSFGGAAKRLNELFMLSRPWWGNSIPTATELGFLQNPWSDCLLNQIASLARFDNKPKILIIHGRSEDRWELKNYLQNSLGLPEPTIMAERISPGEALPIKFEQLASEVDGAIAIATPDDFGGLQAAVDRLTTSERRARQNVWLEVGWFWGRLGRGRVLILSRGELSMPSDLYGIESYQYSTHPTERIHEIQSFVQHVLSGTNRTPN